VKTIDKRLRRGLKSIAAWCKQHRHDPVSEQQKILNAKLRGHYRTRGNPLTWEKFYEVLRHNPLLTPRIMHA
jgi:hypothetical protein